MLLRLLLGAAAILQGGADDDPPAARRLSSTAGGGSDEAFINLGVARIVSRPESLTLSSGAGGACIIDGINVSALAATVASQAEEIRSLRAALELKQNIAPSAPPTFPPPFLPPSLPPTLPPSPSLPPTLPPSPPPKVIVVSGMCDPNADGDYFEHTGTHASGLDCPEHFMSNGQLASCFMKGGANLPLDHYSCRFYLDSQAWGLQCGCNVVAEAGYSTPSCPAHPDGGVFPDGSHHRVYCDFADSSKFLFNSPEQCATWIRRPGCGSCGCDPSGISVTLK